MPAAELAPSCPLRPKNPSGPQTRAGSVGLVVPRSRSLYLASRAAGATGSHVGHFGLCSPVHKEAFTRPWKHGGTSEWMRFMTIFRLLDVARVALKGRGGFEIRAPLLSAWSNQGKKNKSTPAPAASSPPRHRAPAAASAVRAGRGHRPPPRPGPARPRGEAEGLAQGDPVTKPPLREVPKVPPKPPAGPSGWAGRGTRGWPRGGWCQKAAPGRAEPFAARPFTSTPLNPLFSLPGRTPDPRATKTPSPLPGFAPAAPSPVAGPPTTCSRAGTSADASAWQSHDNCRI